MILLNSSFSNLVEMRYKIILPVAILFLSVNSFAQKDSSKKQTINIVSAFKPELRSAAKINFSGSQLTADTSKNLKDYNIPSQNLFYASRAIVTNALSLQQDTNLYLGSRNFVKAGIGNYTTPYVSVGLGIGDGKVFLANAYATYTSSKGHIKNQDFSMFNVKATGSYFMKKNEVYASAATGRDEYYLYGYDHAVVDPKRDDIRQQFQYIDLAGGIRNTVSTQYQLSYNPNVHANFFTNKDRLTETTFIVDLPAEKKIGESFVLKVDAKADITKYTTTGFIPDNYNFSNNVGQVAPALIFNSSRLIVNAGVTPVWENGNFQYLPNVFAEGQLKEKVFMLQAGWIGRIIKNTYKNLSEINPFLGTLTEQNNTTETEFYGGIKATLGKHFNFNAKAGIVNYKNFALFTNDTSAFGNYNNNFKISYERRMQDFRVRGDLSYISQDKFTATASLTLNAYTGLDDNARAWNTVPMEFTGSIRWWAFEHLLLKGDFYLFGGGNYIEAGNKSHPFSGGSDLSAGAEYKINKQFSAFIDVNNIFDNRYERWHNYEVYGLNLLGGIIIHF